MMNSTSTIFTMDLYRHYFKKDAPERELVRVGRIVALSCMLIAVLLAPQLASLDQVFQYIQEYTGMVSPGVLAIFMMGLFWKKATPNSALVSALLSIPLSFLMKIVFPSLPFINRMGIAFLVSVALIVVISYAEGKGKDDPKGISLGRDMLVTDPIFAAAAFGILGITTALYALFW
jgi:SSS family solute:Na+ symporter